MILQSYPGILFRCLRLPLLSSHHISRMALDSPVQGKIQEKLQEQFQPSHLEIVNESFMHNVPKGSETHFKVLVVSDKFKDLSLIKRHRLVHEVLKEELQEHVHALSVVAKTPEQWSSSAQVMEQSPACRGGFGK
ncbi:DNA-binding transcriptional regulator BolA [Oratosquilla oratoria]|uniref:DNA-binding transcriptional regulator BolA n=1 Tax=Oratosquilla oratoria TaxID=337810 RepID=UPI003F75D718